MPVFVKASRRAKAYVRAGRAALYNKANKVNGRTIQRLTLRQPRSAETTITGLGQRGHRQTIKQFRHETTSVQGRRALGKQIRTFKSQRNAAGVKRF